jgi:hypothetical protein
VKIGFYAQGEGPHLDIAKHLIASVKAVMPDVEVFQLTDEKTPCLEGAEALRISGEMPMGVRRLSHYAALQGDWCLVDSDVVFRKDVRDVFWKSFDVALVSRDGTYMAGTDYAAAMPYNFGVVFSRSPRFWRMALSGLKTLPVKLQEWEGEQFVTCELAKRNDFKVEILPCRYNFTPHKKTDDVSEVSILHFKGPRKAWITTQP